MKISKKATTIAIVNQKGGTGKTTTCENLGIGLAMEGKKVLLVDADPQGSLTISMGWQQPDELPTTLSTLMQKAMNDQSIPPGEGILHHAEGVDLIPANIELAGLEVSLVNCMNREKMLKQVLEGAKHEYDFILLDCTPSLGMLTVNALAAADTTLIPVQAQYLSAKGLEQLLQTVQKVRRQINPKLKIEGILLTMTDNRTNYGQQIDNLIRGAYGSKIKVFDQTIPRSVRAAEISAVGKSIFQHDPKGSIVVECGNALLQKGYKLKIFNTINFSKSMRYNPMAYIHSEKDILKLVTALMTNTKGEGQGGDLFWDKAERLLLTSLIAYLHYEAPAEEQNFATLLEMLNTMQVLEDDEEYQNPVDLLFEELAKKKPNSFAGRQYKLYKLAAGKTAKSILISCGARLAPFDIPQLREIMSYDELELDKLGDEKSALFFLISDTDTTYNFLVALAFSQMFNLLCERADNTYGGRLPYHVRVLWDEAANTGQVPGLEKIVAVIRSREISLTLFYQAMSQCKALYKDHSETIMGNMDSIVFLGGREASTLKDISENWLGKATISMQTEGRSRGQSESYSQNMQRLGRELMTTSEITTMPGDKCILQLRGLPPFLSPKYDLKKHPNYKYTAEFDKKKNAFRLESLFRHRPLRLKPDDEYAVYEVDGSDTDEEADLLNFDDLDSDEFV